MSFFDLQKYRRDEYAKSKLEDENKRLQEEIDMARYRQRQDDYDREQQHYRAQERRQREIENERECRFNAIQASQELHDELEDLKLRRKFGIEGDE